ncbi:MAG: 50S ribosomal protein L9 [Flavobacteriales bacterium]|jgi:large subunit ribosomal protein L9|tara:strand:+ start:6771 stop:7205 length:435 start_codon:yes stop_codon:yes gene_type:complete
MNIILLENIEKVGFKDEIVTVKNGYGRNFLIPKGKAVLATTSAVKVLEEKLRQQAQKEEKVITDAKAKVETLKGLDIKIKAKIAGGTKLFGKITLAQFMSAIDGIELDKNFVSLPSAKETGKYEAIIRLHRTVSVTIPFEVIGE